MVLLKSLFLVTIFFEKITKFLRDGDAFSVKIFFSCFPRDKSLFNFLTLKIKMLITSYIKAVDNFKHHIWNQHILLVNILEFEQNGRTLLMSRPSVHPGSRYLENKLTKIKNTFIMRRGRMDGWTDGRDIKSVLRFSSNSSVLTSKMWWFQIWCLKLSAAFLSEVKSNLSFKTRKFNGHLWGRRR